MDLYIVQKATVGAIPREEVQKSTIWSTPGKAIGTGPFKVTGYTPGQSEELSRFDEYHRAKPHLDRIIRREFKDAGSAILAFDKGEVDYTYLTADEVPREQSSTNGTILPGPSGVDLNLVLNPLKNKEWADPRVHQALLYAIDRNSILKNIYHIDDPHPLNCLYKDPTLNPPDVAVYDYNPDKAKQLLADAGIDPAKWGEVVFDTYYQDQGSLDAMTAIQSNLADDRHDGQDPADGQRVLEQTLLRRRCLASCRSSGATADCPVTGMAMAACTPRVPGRRAATVGRATRTAIPPSTSCSTHSSRSSTRPSRRQRCRRFARWTPNMTFRT